jgi:hypothetical protein
MKLTLPILLFQLMITPVTGQSGPNHSAYSLLTGQPVYYQTGYSGAGDVNQASGFRLPAIVGKGTTLRVGLTQAIVPFGVSSDKPGSLFSNNDFTFYLDEEYGVSIEYQLIEGRMFGLQVGGSYFYAKESDRVDDGAVDANNYMTLEGGGVYGGLTWRAGWENFGVRTALNLGWFAFDYRMRLMYKTQFMTGFVTEYKGEAVGGAGSRIDIGFYGEAGRFGIYPSLQMLYLAKNGPSAILLKTLNISAGIAF